MRFTLPAAPTPEVSTSVLCLLNDNGRFYDLRLQYVSDDAAPIIAGLVEGDGLFYGYLATGEGASPAEAILSLLCADEARELHLPAEVAAALAELAHQAVDIVCNRLSGGTMDSATFADEPLGLTEMEMRDERTPEPGSAEEAFHWGKNQEMFGEGYFVADKPACPMCGYGVSHEVIRGPLKCWSCGWYRLELTNIALEGNHPRSMEHVRR